MKTIIDFDKKYTMSDVESSEFDNDTELGMLETYGSDLEKVLKIAKVNPKRVWTVCDSDDGLVIFAGYHLTNRVFYIITDEEWIDVNEEYFYDDYRDIA
jgi:hypothetical protein